jgi:hypothetical protein
MRSAKDVIQLLLTAIAFVMASAVTAWLFFHAGDHVATRGGGAAAVVPQAEFEQRVRDYLLDKPEIIAEAIQKLEARQQLAEQRERRSGRRGRTRFSTIPRPQSAATPRGMSAWWSSLTTTAAIAAKSPRT